MKVMLGQVKPSKAQTRTIGTIEALLLLSEWHPRALHFPTASDGWDCELMVGANNHTTEGLKILEGDTTSNRWLEDVIEPAKRSDRMSWMLMGCALSLAQELGLFEDNSNIDKDQLSYPSFSTEYLVVRRIRVRKHFYDTTEPQPCFDGEDPNRLHDGRRRTVAIVHECLGGTHQISQKCFRYCLSVRLVHA
jgi:hypothetical protein